MIRWQVPEGYGRKTMDELRIYDAMGRLVKNLIPRQSSLVNVVSWDGTDGYGKLVPRGLYFLVLTNGKNKIIINKKVIRAD
jgi:flagellar hook assembly protein FlgD